MTNQQHSAHVAPPFPAFSQRSIPRFSFLVFFWVGWIFLSTSAQEGWLYQSKVADSLDVKSGDSLGWSVDIHKYTLVVGAPKHTVQQVNQAGAAFVFTRDFSTVWTQQGRLTAPTPAIGDLLGNCVGVYGDTVVVGAPKIQSRQGRVFVYQRIYVEGSRAPYKWVRTQELLAPDVQNFFEFGTSCAVDETILAVGAPGRYLFQIPTGAVYVYGLSDPFDDKSAWKFEAILLGRTTTQWDAFGTSVDVAGNHVVAGSPGTDPTITKFDTGGVYVFNRTTSINPVDNSTLVTWSQQGGLLSASDRTSGDQLGLAVAVHDTVIVAGTYLQNASRGAAYVFERDKKTYVWSQTAKLTAVDGGAQDFFAYSVAVTDNTIFIGAPQRDSMNNAQSGAVYVFGRDPVFQTGPWTKQAIILSNDQYGGTNEAAQDYFGWSLAADDLTMIAGSNGDAPRHTGKTSGSASVFVKGVKSSEPPSLSPSSSPSALPSLKPSRSPSQKPSRTPTIEPTSKSPSPPTPSSAPSTDPCSQKARCGGRTKNILEQYFVHQLTGPLDREGNPTSCQSRCILKALVDMYLAKQGYRCGPCPLLAAGF